MEWWERQWDHDPDDCNDWSEDAPPLDTLPDWVIAELLCWWCQVCSGVCDPVTPFFMTFERLPTPYELWLMAWACDWCSGWEPPPPWPPRPDPCTCDPIMIPNYWWDDPLMDFYEWNYWEPGEVRDFGEYGPFHLGRGTYDLLEQDLSPESAGFSWSVGRSYFCRDRDVAGAYTDRNGAQGWNWFQLSQPEIMLADSENDKFDLLYLTRRSDGYSAFARVIDGGSPSATTWRSADRGAGAVYYNSTDDTYTVYDIKGTRMVFFGFDPVTSAPAQGKLWKVIDAAGNVAYAGDPTTKSSAISSGYTAEGNIAAFYDTAVAATGRIARRRFTYTYSGSDIGGAKRLQSVVTETSASGTWSSPGTLTEIGRVEYGYYDDDADDYGQAGDLKTVKVVTPLSESGVSATLETYYRYWENTSWDAGSPGVAHQIQYIVEPEGVRRLDLADDGLLNDSFFDVSEATLQPYAKAYFEYDAERRVAASWLDGNSGTDGNPDGTSRFSYEESGDFAQDLGYDQEWRRRAVVEQPDGTFLTQYFDDWGQPLSRVMTDGDPAGSPAGTWATQVVRDGDGWAVEIHTPANNDSYDHATGELTPLSATGLVNVYEHLSGGDTDGFISERRWKVGDSGAEYMDKALTYTSPSTALAAGVIEVTRHFPATEHIYPDSETSDTDYLETATTLSYHGGDAVLMPETIAVTHPVVTTAKNGPNTAAVDKTYFNPDGTAAFVKAADGIVDYYEYQDGQVTKKIRDADTTKTASGQDFYLITIPSGFSSSGSPLHWVSKTTYDAQGRAVTSIDPNGRKRVSHFTMLAGVGGVEQDGRLVKLDIPLAIAAGLGPTIYSGPVSYTVTNHAMSPEATGIISITGGSTTTAPSGFTDEDEIDPITTVNSGIGQVARLSRRIYGKTGEEELEVRAYFDIPASGDGSDGTNYDATLKRYDKMDRLVRIEDPTGTIAATTFDALGRETSKAIGTDDDPMTGNMVTTVATEYDGGSDGGNGEVSQVTRYLEDSNTGKRETSFLRDGRGRVIVTVSPAAPYVLNQLDNLGQLTAVGLYSSSSGLDATDDPTGLSTNRIALRRVFADEAGRVWKEVVEQVNTDGTLPNVNIDTQNWYDIEGRLLKSDGESLSKVYYDRLGRATNRFSLASTDDSGYGDADDLSGDKVLTEDQVLFQDYTNNVTMRASIARYHDDSGVTQVSGALDQDGVAATITNSSLYGRPQIWAGWYDAQYRLTDGVAFGSYELNDSGGPSSFNRNSGLSSPPSRSDSALRTTYTYGIDGTVTAVTDPKALVSHVDRDDAGRRIATIANYVNGSPSGATAADDNIVRFEYTNRLLSKFGPDTDGDGTIDQPTTYTYGTTIGSDPDDSKIATGNLLLKVQYPDSAGGSDVVTSAYNAQGEVIYTTDQAGVGLQYLYDDLGRQTAVIYDATDSDFDGAVRRIGTAYTSLGLVDTVTQYSNTNGATPVDEVKYNYDYWNNISKIEQDKDSAVGGGGNDYEVAFSYAKVTTGRNTIRRTGMTMPNGASVTYEYLSSNNRLDDVASRVSRVKLGSIVVAAYKGLGDGLVTELNLSEADVYTNLNVSTYGRYSRMDSFNRVTSDRWMAAGPSPDEAFVEAKIVWDRNSNVTRVEDEINTVGRAGSGNGLFDAAYAMDGLNRLTRTQEGNYNSGSTPLPINNTKRDERWEDGSGNANLSRTGNWNRRRLDLNGDGTYTPANGDLDDTGAFNDANEWSTRDTDTSGGVDITLTHDELGNRTGDGDYTYKYDAFGRLREVHAVSGGALVAEYRYNGLGERIAWHYDSGGSAGIDGSDPWYYFVYDDQWRIVATYRDTDTSPKEQFVYHAAGYGGSGGSLPLDNCILRERDINSGWRSSGDGTLEERRYYCHNWRGDVSAVIKVGSDGDADIVERIKYSSYGVPNNLRAGDTDSDGDVDAADLAAIAGGGTLDSRFDITLNGSITSADVTAAGAVGTTGWGVLSQSSEGNRHGYAGYEYDPSLAGTKYQVRYRVLDARLGRWLQRDPAGYVEGPNLYEYCAGNPMAFTDPLGLAGPGEGRGGGGDGGGGGGGAEDLQPGERHKFDPWNQIPEKYNEDHMTWEKLLKELQRLERALKEWHMGTKQEEAVRLARRHIRNEIGRRIYERRMGDGNSWCRTAVGDGSYYGDLDHLKEMQEMIDQLIDDMMEMLGWGFDISMFVLQPEGLVLKVGGKVLGRMLATKAGTLLVEEGGAAIAKGAREFSLKVIECFVAGTLVLTSAGERPIEAIQPGQTVIVPSTTLADGDTASGAAVEPLPDQSWSLVRLDLSSPAGLVCHMTLLRPQSWIDAVGAVEGNIVFIDLPETCERDQALVVSIEPCPKLGIESGQSRLVTGVFQTTHVPVLEVWVLGQTQPIETTAQHRFYSLDIRGWVPAENLHAGERIRAMDGEKRVARVNDRGQRASVYNIEVHSAHAYFVSPQHVLVHNDCVAFNIKFLKNLASRSQVEGAGTVIAGKGTQTAFRDAGRIARAYGGKAEDWVKMRSNSYLAPDGTRMETHWVENLRTHERIEFKTNLWEGAH